MGRLKRDALNISEIMGAWPANDGRVSIKGHTPAVAAGQGPKKKENAQEANLEAQSVHFRVGA